MVYRALTCPFSRANMTGRILPVSQRSTLDLQNYLSHGFNTYSTVFAEVSPNNSGKSKPEEAGTEQKAENGASETELKLRDELTKALNEVASLKKKSSELEVSLFMS